MQGDNYDDDSDDDGDGGGGDDDNDFRIFKLGDRLCRVTR